MLRSIDAFQDREPAVRDPACPLPVDIEDADRPLVDPALLNIKVMTGQKDEMLFLLNLTPFQLSKRPFRTQHTRPTPSTPHLEVPPFFDEDHPSIARVLKDSSSKRKHRKSRQSSSMSAATTKFLKEVRSK